MRELAVQSSNGTLAAADRAALEKEAQALETEITRIADTTTWAGVNLLDGSLSDGVTIQAGTDAGGANLITVSIAEMSSSAATINIATQSIGTFTDAQAAITAIDGALSGVSEVRGALGAISNRLNSTIANMDQVRVNLSASVGRIEDADFAQETGNLAKNQILQQAATAMLAQANASKSSVLTLVR
jgi:flagellin